MIRYRDDSIPQHSRKAHVAPMLAEVSKHTCGPYLFPGSENVSKMPSDAFSDCVAHNAKAVPPPPPAPHTQTHRMGDGN